MSELHINPRLSLPAGDQCVPMASAGNWGKQELGADPNPDLQQLPLCEPGCSWLPLRGTVTVGLCPCPALHRAHLHRGARQLLLQGCPQPGQQFPGCETRLLRMGPSARCGSPCTLWIPLCLSEQVVILPEIKNPDDTRKQAQIKENKQNG